MITKFEDFQTHIETSQNEIKHKNDQIDILTANLTGLETDNSTITKQLEIKSKNIDFTCPEVVGIFGIFGGRSRDSGTHQAILTDPATSRHQFA